MNEFIIVMDGMGLLIVVRIWIEHRFSLLLVHNIACIHKVVIIIMIIIIFNERVNYYELNIVILVDYIC